MSDLDQLVRSWREAAAGRLGDDRALLDELEAHLRDEFDRLIAAGQSPEHAWDAAVKTLGDPRKLAREFAKAQKEYWLAAWVTCILLAILVGLLAWFIIARVVPGAVRPLLAVHIAFVTAGYAAVLTTGFLGTCAVLIRAVWGWTDRQDAALRAAGGGLALGAVLATLIGCALGAWWARDNFGRWWGWDPREIGGLCVLGWSGVLLHCFRSGQSSSQSRLCLAVIANMIVAVSWLGPALLPAGLHSYGYPTSQPGMFLGGFLVAHILVVYLAMLPAGALRPSRYRAAR